MANPHSRALSPPDSLFNNFIFVSTLTCTYSINIQFSYSIFTSKTLKFKKRKKRDHIICSYIVFCP